MPLFTVRNKVLALHKTQMIEAMEGTDLCTVKKKFSSAFLSSSSPLFSLFLVPIPVLVFSLRIAHCFIVYHRT